MENWWDCKVDVEFTKVKGWIKEALKDEGQLQEQIFVGSVFDDGTAVKYL